MCCSRRSDFPGLVIHMEICEDVWTPIPPSSRAALAGRDCAAQSLGHQRHRRQVGLPADALRGAFGRCLAAYLYSAAGQGESTTDLAWDGEAMIYENGALLAKAPRFADEPQLIVADVDIRSAHG